MGYQNAIMFFEPIDKAIHIELQLPEGAPQPSKLDLVGAVLHRVPADRAHGLWPDHHAAVSRG